jgi:hypothetical protein
VYVLDVDFIISHAIGGLQDLNSCGNLVTPTTVVVLPAFQTPKLQVAEVAAEGRASSMG